MWKHDDDAGLIGLILIVGAIGLIIYAIIALSMIILFVGGAAGTVYGGGTAILNYCKSFKENTIDSNPNLITEKKAA